MTFAIAGLFFCVGWLLCRLHAEKTIIAGLNRRIDQLYNHLQR